MLLAKVTGQPTPGRFCVVRRKMWGLNNGLRNPAEAPRFGSCACRSEGKTWGPGRATTR